MRRRVRGKKEKAVQYWQQFGSYSTLTQLTATGVVFSESAIAPVYLL